MKKVFLENLPKQKGYNGKRISWKDSIGEKVKFEYNDICGEVEIVDYKNPKLYLKYKNSLKEITTSKFIKCELGRIIGIITREFKIEIGDNFKDSKRDLVVIDREYRDRVDGDTNNKWYKYHCNKCGAELWTLESELFRGTGCACCCVPPQATVEGINDIPTTAPWMVKYFQGGYDEAKLYTKNSNKKIYPICPDCGRIKEKETQINWIYRYKSIRCTCSDGISQPNKILRNLIYEISSIYSIEYEFEYNRNWTNRKYYDAYIKYENKEYFIEMDGFFHKNDNPLNGMSAIDSRNNDNYKDCIAMDNNIEVIRIDCEKLDFEFIKNNLLNSELNKLFDLNVLNWSKINENCYKNIVKEVCFFKSNNKEMRIGQIGKAFDLDRATIWKYLKIGEKFGWCVYSENECFKKIEIFKDNISFGIFESIAEMIRYMEQNHNIKLGDTNVSAVAKGRRKHHKGFTFKYIEQ